MASSSPHSSGVQSVPLDTFSGRHRTLGYAVNGIPLPTQPYLATAPIVQGSTIDTGKHFTLFFSSPDSQTLALLSSGAIATLQFLLADGRAPSAKVQITSSLSGSTLLVDVLVLSDASTATATLPFVLLQQDGSTRMTQVFGEIPEDIKDKPLLGLYDPVTHSAVAAQAGTTVTDNTNSVVYAPLAGSGGGGGGGAVTIADGANVTFGTETDAASTDATQINKTHMSFLKGLIKIFADTWDSTNHWLQIKVMSGTVTANAGTNLNTSTLALESGGNLATLVTNTTGVATAANQSTANTSLSSVATNTSNTATVAGATGDTAVTGDNTGTLSAKLRGLNKAIADIWDSTNHWLQVKVMNGNANGQALMANSAPVVIASDQTTLSIKRSAVAVFTQASGATSGSTQNSGDLSIGLYTEISIDINTTAQSGTNPTIQYFWERKGADGLYYVLWQTNVLTLAANTLSTSIGAGMAYNQSLGLTGRLRWVIGGTSTPTFTHSLNVYGK